MRETPAASAWETGTALTRGGRTIEVTGAITTDTVWDADTVRVMDDVTVAGGVRLTILPGVRVAFAGYFALYVEGTLWAAGTPDARIAFTHEDPSGFAVDSTHVGCWHGIRFINTPATNPPSRLSYCRIEYVKGVGDGSRGGAFHFYDTSQVTIANCIIEHNVADYGAVAYCSNKSSPTFVGNLIHDNHAFWTAPVVFAIDSYPRVVHNTIVANHSRIEEIFWDTAVIHNHIAKTHVRGNIIWDNTTHYFLPGHIFMGKPYYITYNDIEEGHDGEGNFEADPLFQLSGDHPYALAKTSPCIGAGAPDTTGLELPVLDLAGVARLTGERIDAGAYEWHPVSAAPDPAIAGRGPALHICPNPAVTAAHIRLVLARPAAAEVAIYDASGRRVAMVAAGRFGDGEHSLTWDGRDDRGRRLAAGTYFCRLCAAGEAPRDRALLLLR